MVIGKMEVGEVNFRIELSERSARGRNAYKRLRIGRRLATASVLIKIAAGLLALCGTLFGGSDEFPPVSSVYTRYAADNPANLTVPPLSQAFAPDDVDVEKGVLRLPDIGFSAISYTNGIGTVMPVYFSSTGMLPAPLQPATPYYVVPAGGGYRVYAVSVDADAIFQPGGVPGEKVLPAQNVSQGVNSIVFTSAGTGTHTLHTKTLVSQLTDLTANGYSSIALGAANKHALLELGTDTDGKKCLWTAGATARENFMGSYNAYGQTFIQGPSPRRLEARQQVGGKRVVYQIFVCKVRSYKERQVVKFLDDPASVSIATDQINYAADHRMTNKIGTGDLIRAKAYAGSTLPAPLVEGTDYYACKVDNKNITLHPTAADAAGNANVINLTTTGSGSFLFWCPERVGDARRWSFFAEVLAPNSGGNTLSVRLQEPLPSSSSILKNAKSFITDGPNKGNVAGLGAVPELRPVTLWAAPGAALPAPLRPGVRYWATQVPGSKKDGRLHETLASAQESAGKATNLSSCIKYSAVGSGETLVSYDDDASAIGFGTLGGTYEPFSKRVPLGPLCILVFKMDFNDPAEPWAVATLGLNEAVTERKPVVNLAKGPTPEAIKDGSAAWTLFNSAQGHVPIDLDLYEMVFGSSTDAVADSEIQGMVDYFKKKYQIEK